VGGVVDVELDVDALLAERGSGDPVVRGLIADVTRGLDSVDVLLYTSRRRRAGAGAAASLAIARTVSAALVRAVRGALAARPARVVGKGGITSHDIALHGLGIRRAEVTGQLFPGVVSVLCPIDAPAAAVVGVTYVVFAGNVGDDSSLAQAVDMLRANVTG
jgi:uncharacterized protein YgbK (DUF1537 family)